MHLHHSSAAHSITAHGGAVACLASGRMDLSCIRVAGATRVPSRGGSVRATSVIVIRFLYSVDSGLCRQPQSRVPYLGV
jgi:hypothetical protein